MQNRVCHITTVHKAFDTRIFQRECCSLAKRGFDIHLIVANQKAQKVKGVTIHNINSPTTNRIQRMSKTTQLAFEKALELDAAIYHFHDPELLPIGKKLKKRGKIVIYDCHEDVAGQIRLKSYIPSLLRPLIARGFDAYEKRTAKNFDAIIAANDFVKDRFLALGANAIIINNFPKTDAIQAQQDWSKKTVDVFYVGHINRIRAVKEMVQMMEFTDARFTLGGNFETEALFEQTKKIPHWHKVNYVGRIPRVETIDLLNSSKIGLVTFLPVPYHLHSQSNKMFEYMAAGIPLIASDFPLWRKIIDEVNCGLCVDPTNPKAIAEAINYLLEHEEEAQAMGRRGREAVLKKYNWKTQEDKLVELYEELLNNSSKVRT